MKKQAKRLVLSKETLALIQEGPLSKAVGDISGSICGWDTCYQICHGTKTC